MQEQKLHDNQKQAKDTGQACFKKILSDLQDAYTAQGNQIGVLDMQASSSNG